MVQIPTCPCTTAILCLHLPLCSEATLIQVCRWELNIHTSWLLIWPPREKEAVIALMSSCYPPAPLEELEVRVPNSKEELRGDIKKGTPPQPGVKLQ